MEFKEWFSKLTDDTKLWLVQNMGSPLPAEISKEIVAAGGPSELSSSDAEWIERVNNGDDIGV
ncbi:MAG: hypothetical protein V4479_11745 [Actinomycetota bacterium]